MSPQQELSESAALLDLTEDRLDRNRAFGVPASPARRAQCAAHAVRDRAPGGSPAARGRRACPFVGLPIGRDQGRTAPRGEGLDSLFTLGARIQAGDRGEMPRIGDGLRPQRLRLLVIIRGVRHIGGDDDLCRRIDYGLAVRALDKAARVA